MRKRKGQFPDGWNYSKFPDHYYYKGIMVKRKDRGRGMIELEAIDEQERRHAVLAKGLREAMREMEVKLKNNCI